jgi:hypothetical protein
LHWKFTGAFHVADDICQNNDHDQLWFTAL